jgi:hypothetical protein
MLCLVVFSFAKERNFASFATTLLNLTDFPDTWHTRRNVIRLEKPKVQLIVSLIVSYNMADAGICEFREGLVPLDMGL